MKFVVLTDLHLVAPGRRLYGLDPRERLEAALTDIAAHHADADFLVITGDLAHGGDRAAYEMLRSALNGFPLPAHLLIGNHDDRATFRQVFPSAPTDENGFVQQVIKTAEGTIILLDTNQSGTHSGAVCAQRLAWLERTLAENFGQPVFLALHHPPLPLGIPPMDAIALAEPEAFGNLVQQHGSVRAMFFGHVHRPIHGTWNGVPFFTQRGLNHQVALTLDAASGIPATLEPPCYSVATLNGPTMVVHTHDFLDISPRFDLFDPRAEQAQSIAELA